MHHVCISQRKYKKACLRQLAPLHQGGALRRRRGVRQPRRGGLESADVRSRLCLPIHGDDLLGDTDISRRSRGVARVVRGSLGDDCADDIGSRGEGLRTNRIERAVDP